MRGPRPAPSGQRMDQAVHLNEHALHPVQPLHPKASTLLVSARPVRFPSASTAVGGQRVLECVHFLFGVLVETSYCVKRRTIRSVGSSYMFALYSSALWILEAIPIV